MFLIRHVLALSQFAHIYSGRNVELSCPESATLYTFEMCREFQFLSVLSFTVGVVEY
jgi:hypothetical protein